MARLAKIVNNDKKKKLATKYKALRAELRAKVIDESLTDEERYEAVVKLQKLPRNSAEIRVRNRCAVTGRSQGYYRKFGISRIALRELGLRGLIPGVTKSSW